MATLFGHINEFNPEKEDWIQYAERLEHFFAANSIDEPNKKKAMLLTVIGPTAYRLMRSLVAPQKLDEKTFKELVDAMKDHYCPKPSEIVQRFKFNTRARQPGESVSTYVSQLRSLAEYCNYGASLNNMLRDRLVCGINDMQIQRRLLSKKDLTFETALEEAVGQETAARNVQTLQGTEAAVGEVVNEDSAVVRKVDRQRKQTHWPTSQSQPFSGGGECFRCGQRGHTAAKCRFRTAKCHQCGRIGHIRSQCRSQLKRPIMYHDQQSEVKSLQETDSSQQEFQTDSSHQEYSLFAVNSKYASRNPIEVELVLDGRPVSMEVDTGASLSLVSKSTFEQLWPGRSLQASTVQLRTYTGESLPVLGSVKVQAKHGSKEAGELPLLIVSGEGPSLLGRNWLQNLHLDWREIHKVHDSHLDEVVCRHSTVFRDELGTLKGFKAKIYVDPSVRPRFCKARSVPYSMLNLVEKELERLVKLGIIEPVQFADWAAPIVPVLKADKRSVRICGDFKMTVNQASCLDRYPIPKGEDLFAGLHGGKNFTKLDMSQAYQQILLDEDSKQLLVVNTHRGLFRYNRLPFGISSAPGIFQRTMETLLQDIPHVVVYIDDILITGPTEEAHLNTLDKVLDRLETAGLRLKKSKCILMAPSVEYLGHRIDKHGLHPTEEKIRAVQEAPEPQNVTELKSFLGLISYYGKFLPNLSTTLAPLYNLLRSSTKWRWTVQRSKLSRLQRACWLPHEYWSTLTQAKT